MDELSVNVPPMDQRLSKEELEACAEEWFQADGLDNTAWAVRVAREAAVLHERNRRLRDAMAASGVAARFILDIERGDLS